MDQVFDLFRRTLRMAWRRRWAGLAVAWLVCLVGWAGVHFIPDQYKVNARLYVDTDAVLTPLLRGVAAETSTSDQLTVLQRTLISRPNLQTVISKTDLGLQATTPQMREELITKLESDITVTSQGGNLFSISYTNQNPRLARDVVQTLLSIFIESATGTNRGDMDNALRFLQLQISSYEIQLHAMEEKRAAFRTKYAGILPEDGAVNGINAAREGLAKTKAALVDAEAIVSGIKSRMVGVPPTLPGARIAGVAGGENGALAQAQAQLNQMLTVYTNDYPGVIQQRKLVESLRHSGGGAGGRAAEQGAAVPNPLYDQLSLKLLDEQATVASLNRQVKHDQDALDRIEAIQKEQPGLLAQYANVDRNYGVLQKNYDELVTRLQAARIAQAANTQADKVHLRVIDPPEVPTVPVAPNRPVLLTGVFLAGLLAGLGAAALLAQFDRSFATLEDLRSLGLPVLGGLSAMGRASLRRRALAVGEFSFALVLLAGLYGGLLIRMLRATGTV